MRLIHSIYQLDHGLEEPITATRGRRSQRNANQGPSNTVQGREDDLAPEQAVQRGLSSDIEAVTGNQKKIAKAARKTAKHQSVIKVVTEAELKHLNNVLHPEHVFNASQSRENRQGLTNNATIDANIAYNASTSKRIVVSKRALNATKQAQRKDGVTQNNNSPHPDPSWLDSILRKLSVDPCPTHASKLRKSLDVQLRNAITYDIEVLAKEEEQTMIRMAGYWRYANRRTYNAMIRNNQLWDWSTGEKLPEIEEEADGGAVADDNAVVAPAAIDQDADADAPAPDPQAPAADVPENWDDDDNESEPSDDVSVGEVSEESSVTELPPAADDDQVLALDLANAAVHQSQEAFEMNTLPWDYWTTYVPGRAPGPTITFRVPSPASSDDGSDNGSSPSSPSSSDDDSPDDSADGWVEVDENNRFGRLKNELPVPNER